MNGLLDAALRYAPRTIPLEPRGKRPNVGRDWPSWVATPDSIRAHWQRHPDSNVGVRTGRGLVVLDIDPRAGGDDNLADLEHEHGDLPPTIAVQTGGGGRHLYFRGPKDVASCDLGAGVEVKAAGRQVVAPPSLHPDTGALYEWAPDHAPGQVPLADLPAWITAERVSSGPQRTPTSEWIAIVRDGLPTGGRNHGLARLVGHLLARDIDARLAHEIAHLINTARCTPPLSRREVDAIVESIAGREAHKRTRGRR